jgi:PncC family amidohydrolase
MIGGNLKIPLAKKVGNLLISQNLHLVTAESCTGGLLSNMITDIPGSSEYFIGGVSTYSYEAKEKILGVNHETLVNFGAVSEETVKEMAIGARKVFSGSVPFDQILGVSVSGIAGPGGGMPGKPVGLVWFGLSTQKDTIAIKQVWTGNRIQNKKSSAIFALQLIESFLKNS